MEADAAAIRFRAERRIGQLMAEQARTIGSAKGRRSDLGLQETQVATLAEAGIDKHLADKARKAAALTEKQFEAAVEEIATRRRSSGGRGVSV